MPAKIKTDLIPPMHTFDVDEGILFAVSLHSESSETPLIKLLFRSPVCEKLVDGSAFHEWKQPYMDQTGRN